MLVKLMATGLSGILGIIALNAGAQTVYPLRPVRIVVPYAPGGGTDINARNVAPKLTELWHQSVVIDNRPGGNAMIGADIVAKAAPDGYTMLLSTSSEIVTVQSLFKSVPYDALRDFEPVTLASTTPVIITAHPSTNVKTIKDLVATAGQRKYSFASVGTASPQHLAGEWLKTLAKIDMVHIPFKGAGPALNDNLGGHVPIGFLSLLPAVPHVKAGRLNALAVTSGTRSPAFTRVTRCADDERFGLPGYRTGTVVWCIFAGQDAACDHRQSERRYEPHIPFAGCERASRGGWRGCAGDDDAGAVWRICAR